MTEPSSDTFSQRNTLPAPSVLRHVVDVHCHPTDTVVSPASMDKLPIKICAMATRDSDQCKVAELATAYPEKVVPCFGYHPWFTHWISIHPVSSKEDHYKSIFLPKSSAPHSDEQLRIFETMLSSLPEPTPLSSVLNDLRLNLAKFASAMLGEVGLDRSARVPMHPSSTPRVLSPFSIPIEHQIKILEAQLELAVELRRNVSLHNVKAHQATVELLRRMKQKHGARWDAISIDLHSCGISPQMWKDIEKSQPNVYFSLSTAINSRSPNHIALIKACSPERILVESDIHDVDYCAQYTWDVTKIIADIKGWTVEESWDYDEQGDSADAETWGVVRRLEENWKMFQRGDHQSVQKSKVKGTEWVTGGNRKERKRSEKDLNEWVSEDSDPEK